MFNFKSLAIASILWIFTEATSAADLSSISAINCYTPKNAIAKSLCLDSDFVDLDRKMKSNYLAMISSDIGGVAKNDLKINQDKWKGKLNKCETKKCIKLEYEKRINEICDYPVITGVYPVCESAE